MPKKNENGIVFRRHAILELTKEKGTVLIEDLSNQFSVSEVTIRNDLEYLEKKNLLIRSRGGAFNFDHQVGIDPSILKKGKIHTLEKMAIGKRAAQLIRENETIILDSGTTTAQIAKNLGDIKSLTVITNAINIITSLITEPNISLIVPGGTSRQNSMSLIGPMAERNLKGFFVDKAFLSTDGFDTGRGIFTPNIEEASLNTVMIANAKEVILVTDSSKFNRRSLVFICGLDKIKTVVTDKGISKEDVEKLKSAGIQVLIAT